MDRPDKVDPALIEYLAQYVTDHKKQKIEEVLAQRSRYLTVVLEDIYKPHNASAVLRTCDCFGVQDIHIIEGKEGYKVNPYVTRGAAQWLTLHQYPMSDQSNVTTCFDKLRASGYKILATSPVADSQPLADIIPDQKIALVFGNEHAGVSEEVIAQADGLVYVPMRGFTESFNISVTAAICLSELQRKLDLMPEIDTFLTEEEKQALRQEWYFEIVKHAPTHLKAFYKNQLKSKD
ncbi:TrmH family RNA methyltransferase [Penaeicola halotolerans]|uniref:TrmH family RNA methyltransferase n=1 Tax=Penaeicola halotolerans TaxID=2793196 RepID=UPI001CF8E584|nr:RNA methyltransferase [Penaeicola halotolerans]